MHIHLKCFKLFFQVSFDKKKEELFEMVCLFQCMILCYFFVNSNTYIIFFQISIPAWFTIDSRLGNLSVHLDTPQCFSAEMYSFDLGIREKPEDDKVCIFFCVFLVCVIVYEIITSKGKFMEVRLYLQAS